VVALSSCEAEYISSAHCARQIIWLRSLFSELGFPQNDPSLLRCHDVTTRVPSFAHTTHILITE
jgi:hypothetical protein